MSFVKGSVNVTMFKLGKLPEDYLSMFAAYAAGKLEELKDEPQLGWTSGRHLLETKIDETTAICGGHLYLNLRKAERKIPVVLMQTLCNREEQIYMQSNQAEFVPARVKREIRQNMIESHLMKMQPTISGIPFVIDLTTNILYAGTSSQGQLDDLVCCFLKTTGIEPIHYTISEMCADMGIQEADLPSVSFSETASSDLTPARDFLSWLWYYNEKFGGRVSHDQFGDFDLLVEGPLSFAAADEARGSDEVAIKKGGCPMRSAETKAALIVGKKLKKAKLTIVRGEDIWTCTFDADKVAFSSLKLPEGQEMESHTRFAERILNLDIFRQAIQAYFNMFVNTVRSSKWTETEKNLQTWALERDSY